jgi:hypothetical protein
MTKHIKFKKLSQAGIYIMLKWKLYLLKKAKTSGKLFVQVHSHLTD